MPNMRLRPAGGAYSTPPDSLAGNRGGAPGRGGKGRGGGGKGRGGRGWGKGKGRAIPPRKKILATALSVTVARIVAMLLNIY